MTSLNLIMDMDDEPQDPQSNKKDKVSSPSGGVQRQDPFSSCHDTPNQLQEDPSLALGKRREAPSRAGKSASTASSSTSSATRPTTARRLSSTSTEEMDPTGYGRLPASAAPHPANSPMRPMASTGPSEMPLRLTPITGRVSRAKKGLAVHTCEKCHPPKTFTRAEHLRRHELSHKTPQHACRYSGCPRAFHRPDLLLRHEKRHEQEGDRLPGNEESNDGRRESATPSTDERNQVMTFQNVSAGRPHTPSSSSLDTQTSVYPPSQPTFHQRNPSDPRTPRTGNAPYNIPTSGFTDRHSISSVSSGAYTDASPIYAPVVSSPDTYQNPDEFVPRTTPPSIFIDTHNVPSQSQAEMPGLTYAASPWTSASESPYSTPPSDAPRGSAWLSRAAVSGGDYLTVSPSPLSVSTTREMHSPGGESVATSSTYLFPTQAYSNVGSHAQSYGSIAYMPVSPFSENNLMSPTHHSPARSLTPSVAASTQSSDTLVTPSAGLPIMTPFGRQKDIPDYQDSVDVTHPGLGAGVGGGSLPASFGGGVTMMGDGDSSGFWTGINYMGGPYGALSIGSAIDIPRSLRNAIPDYLNVYWDRFHEQYPIVHRPSFEQGGEDVLRCAMAAIATQFFDNKEDRNRGHQLHEHALIGTKQYASWSIQAMQAILLCEMFSRFRGRKALTRSSPEFESLYTRVLDSSCQAVFDPVTMSTPEHVTHVTQGMVGSNEDRWSIWKDAEGRRRLLTSCFLVDIHTSVYYGLPRTRDFNHSVPGTNPPIPLSTNTDRLWAAASADEWAAIVAENPHMYTTRWLPWPGGVEPDYLATHTAFDRAAILAAEVLRLPSRSQRDRSFPVPGGMEGSVVPHGHPAEIMGGNQYFVNPSDGLSESQTEERIFTLFNNCPVANTYLALHHTPLHDLLAVSGDSWLFTQKINQQGSFHDHKRRLRIWAESHDSQKMMSTMGHGQSVTQATIYASRAIVAFLERSRGRQEQGAGAGAQDWNEDISDYWALYVCALVCWAYTYKARAHSNMYDAKADPDAGENARDDDMAASQWLNTVASMGSDQVASVRSRSEGTKVLGLVRRRLEWACGGSKSRLFVDAVNILRKLEEGVNWPWF